MKNFLLLLAFVGLFACNQSGSSVSESIDLSGFETSKLKGSDVVHAVKKDMEGKLAMEGFLRNGKKEGQWITYDPVKGTVAILESYVNGKLNGYSFKVSSRGYLDEQIGYLNNELNGKYAQFKYGRLESESYYKNGKLDGLQKQYYDNGKLQQETEFKDGLQDGVYNYYSDDGLLRMSYTYKNGEKIAGGIVEVPDNPEENNE